MRAPMPATPCHAKRRMIANSASRDQRLLRSGSSSPGLPCPLPAVADALHFARVRPGLTRTDGRRPALPSGARRASFGSGLRSDNFGSAPSLRLNSVADIQTEASEDSWRVFLTVGTLAMGVWPKLRRA